MEYKINFYYDNSDLKDRLAKALTVYDDVPFTAENARDIVWLAQKLGIIDCDIEEPSNDPDDYNDDDDHFEALDYYAFEVSLVVEKCLDWLEELDKKEKQ